MACPRVRRRGVHVAMLAVVSGVVYLGARWVHGMGAYVGMSMGAYMGMGASWQFWHTL